MSEFKGWNEKEKRWRKMFRGRRYSITASELGFTNRKDSTPAARKWWEQVKAGLIQPDGVNPNQAVIDDLNQRIQTSKQLGFHDEIEGLKAKLDLVKRAPKLNKPQLDLIYGRLSKIEVTPTSVKAVEISHEDAIHNDRAKRIKLTPTEESAETLKKIFLDQHDVKATIGSKSRGRYLNLKTGVKKFVDWFGETRSVRTITNHTVEDYYNVCLKSVADGLSGDTAKSHFQTAQQFISYASFKTDSPKPNALYRQDWEFPTGRKEIQTFTTDELKILIANADPQMKAWILLHINCGFLATDLNDLEANEVDWENGRINRARTKTKKLYSTKQGCTPIKINRKLWPSTLASLKAVGNRTGFVLRDGDKSLMVETKNSVRSIISEKFVDYIKKLKAAKLLPEKFNKAFDDLRKTGSDLIEHSEDHSTARPAYLAHEGLALTSYIKSGKVKPAFDKAIIWLGQELKLLNV